jgi:hypothetical protein
LVNTICQSFRQASNAISAALDWRAVANAPTYAELERRRTTYDRRPLTPEQIRRKADESWTNVARRIGRGKAA